jgi:hypothetical protein
LPLYYFICRQCKEPLRKVIEPEKVKGLRCPKCQGKLKRYPSPPAVHFKNHIDNGLMPKGLENFDDAQQITHERSKLDLSRPDWMPKQEE